jgi:hypothetical protein
MLQATIAGDKRQTFMKMVDFAWAKASTQQQNAMAMSEKADGQLRRVRDILEDSGTASRTITLSREN